MDVTPIPCGQDGRAHRAAVMDSHDQEIVGYEFALRSWAGHQGYPVSRAIRHAPIHSRPGVA